MSQKILVVDDEPGIVESYKAILKQQVIKL